MDFFAGEIGGEMPAVFLGKTFDAAVDAVIKWVEKNSNWNETLVIVTGDHETGYLTGPGASGERNQIVNNGKGKLPGMKWNSPEHTNLLIPVFAKGAAARQLKNRAVGTDPVRGSYIDNTDIGKLIISLWG